VSSSPPRRRSRRFEKDLGPQIASALLVANDSFLVGRLREQLKKVRSGDALGSKRTSDEGSRRASGLAIGEGWTAWAATPPTEARPDSLNRCVGGCDAGSGCSKHPSRALINATLGR
jgi:hypothetical protein